MATAMKLIGTGIGMGVVHVLTGPDHMSALATLSSSSSSSLEGTPTSKCYLFGLGARWGIGHSTGLLVVGGIFILKDVLQNDNDDNDVVEIPDWLTRLFESFVGVFMLVLGIYGIWEAYRMIQTGQYASVEEENALSNETGEEIISDSNLHRRYSDDDAFQDEGSSSSSSSSSEEFTGVTAAAPLEVEPRDANDENDDDNLDSDIHPNGLRPDYEAWRDDEHHHHHHHQHHHHHHNTSHSPCLAFCAGIFHGLAGPGGVLGVVPAIQLHDAGLAACYLASFCASSTLTMGCFAALWGSGTAVVARGCSGIQRRRREHHHQEDGEQDDDEVAAAAAASHESSSIATVEFWIRCVSASLSILVGVMWLVLLAMGKLEDVFG